MEVNIFCLSVASISSCFSGNFAINQHHEFMSRPGSSTTANHIDFDATLNKSIRIMKENTGARLKIAFLAICGIHLGLRVSDLLNLRHKDMEGDTIRIVEKKTGKARTLRVNQTVKDAYRLYASKVGDLRAEDYLFVSQKRTRYSVRQVNRLLQAVYGTKNKNISSHSLRKTFGRRVWDRDNNSERALILLSKLFNHTSTETTRIYLGIEQEELDDIYLNL